MLGKLILASLLAISARAAKTDLAGCTLTSVALLTEIVTTTGANGVVGSFGNYQYTTFQWDGQEQCQLLDCGGGRAPPKSTVPGCPLYTGTDTVPSIPFPTASLTLNNAAVATSTPAAGGASAVPGSSAPDSPVPTSTPPAPTASGAVSPGASSAPASASSDSPSPTVAPAASDNSSGSAVSGANPASTSNGAVTTVGRGGVFFGLAAIAAAVLSV